MHSKWKWCGHKITTIYSHTSIITIIIFVACSARSPHYGSPYLRSPCISGPSITALLDDRKRRVRFFERQRKGALLIHSLLFIIWFPRQVALVQQQFARFVPCSTIIHQIIHTYLNNTPDNTYYHNQFSFYCI